ncbi:group 1 truncated hemoglobin [Pseudomonas neustonica]|uniref:Group 1 truncated hemoglobin n=1 Tax=Pseudomonas neustonica TaxID=2487346 RepID=A0ABX9XNH4_9PSED|nr:group 1 truncated hemoglobin [Pseudomonas sp. SSM44]ROZ88490.1 group 1 truncated hemoglobin [Pseudomonas neustonica]|tara:strand:- start:852 stop:1292 length:441 start_codon:yes stop_codon:yes gene_type:complete
MRRFTFKDLSLSLLFLGLAGCMTSAPPANDSLYQDLGSQAGINRVVEGLLYRIADDPRIVHHFADTDIARLQEKLQEQICVEAGGPCEYTGDSMEQVHAGFVINETDFNALVEDLIAAMDEEGIPVRVQNRLLQRLVPMRDDIIYR